MIVIQKVQDLSSEPKVLCIGNFDGVHLGHQSLFRRMTTCDSNLEKVVLSFQPHPAEVLMPDQVFLKIQQWSEMPVLLADYGIDTLVLQEFTKEFTKLGAEEFIVDWLVPNVNPQFIVIGEDFSFGRKQSGDVNLLKNYAKKLNFKIVVAPTVLWQGQKVSSTLVREFLVKGELDKVHQLLGRHYFLEGFCELGEGRGRELGFPTLNVSLEDSLAICSGVYICYLIEKESSLRRPAIANIGRAPTFSKSRKMILEVHMLDFVEVSGQVRVELVEFVRPEIKFPNRESLVHQIQIDVQKAKEFFRVTSR